MSSLILGTPHTASLQDGHSRHCVCLLPRLKPSSRINLEINMLRRVVPLLLALVGTAQCFFAPTLPVMSLRGSNTRLRVTMQQQSGGSSKKAPSWQDVAERLGSPFVSPFEKASLAADLLAMREEVVSSISKV
jgi:hypothetical protein